jgi:hypothetical protein
MQLDKLGIWPAINDELYLEMTEKRKKSGKLVRFHKPILDWLKLQAKKETGGDVNALLEQIVLEYKGKVEK